MAPTKSSIKIKPGINVDLRVVPKESYGAALNYFTGSKDHNVVIRALANKKGLKLNEYGLFKIDKKTGGKAAEGKGMRVAGRTEEEIYKTLGMAYVEPELRENTGEVEAALEARRLPKLIGYGDLQGDLQTQTDWTDGAESIEAMARRRMPRAQIYRGHRSYQAPRDDARPGRKAHPRAMEGDRRGEQKTARAK